MRARATHAIRVWGPLALFTMPHLKGNPYSYPIITPSAATMLLRNLYGKPEMEWEIARIHLLNPVRYWTTKMRVKSSWSDKEGSTIQAITVLMDVNYIIEARIVLNHARLDRGHLRHLSIQERYAKYLGEATKRLKRNESFRDPYFGVTEYPAHWEYVPLNEIPPALPVTEDLGSMLLNMVPVNPRKDRWDPVFFRARLENGILEIPESLYEKPREQTMASRVNAYAHR